MKFKKIGLILATGALAITAVTACGGNNNAGNSAADNQSQSQNQSAAGDEIVDIEVWGTNIGYKPIEKGSKLYEFYKEKLGVGVLHPYVEWNGGRIT